MRLVVPAHAKLAAPGDARAQAAAGDGCSSGRRVHTVRHGQRSMAWRDRLEPEVGGLTGLPPADQDGTPGPGPHAHRRDVPAHLLHAVVGRTWHGREEGPGGNPSS